MRIGIDARPLQAETRFRGIGKSLENTLRALAGIDMPEGTQLVFFIDSVLEPPEVLKLFPDASIQQIVSSERRKGKYARIFFTGFRAISPAPGSVDVLLQADASLGVPRTVPTVAIFYDLIPVLFRQQERELEDFPSTYRKYKREIGRRGGWAKYLRMLNSYKRAVEILAISESSRRDLIAHRKEIDPKKTRVIHLGVSQDTGGSTPSQDIKRLAESPYLLYVGGIDVRKNIVSLLKTYIELRNTHPSLRLIVVGKEFELDKQLETIGWKKLLRDNPDAAQDVIVPGFLNDADLHYLYGKAAAFVFPSRYEGFGLPVLEAMKFGCPVVAYDNSSIPEVAGDAALLVADGEDMKPAIRKLLDSEVVRKELTAKGLKQARGFTWEATARETLEALIEVASRSTRGK